MQDKIRSQFDETLARHFERLIGTREGIAGLPLNLATISCLVLLAERELEIENVPTDSPERYTHDSLFSDAADVGIKSDDYLNTALQALTDRGYVDVGEGGQLLTRKPAMSMARLLNLLFPKMPGMSLLAYAGQALDEVMTDRTEYGSAIDRFDQTLKLHGVPPGKQKSDTWADPKKGSNGGDADPQGQVKDRRNAGVDQKRARLSREDLLLKLRERVETIQPSSAPSQTSDSSRILSGGEAKKPLRRDDVVPREPRRSQAEEYLRTRTKEPPAETPMPIPDESLTPILVEESIGTAQAEVSHVAVEVPDQEEPGQAPVETSEAVPEVVRSNAEDKRLEEPEEKKDEDQAADDRDDRVTEDEAIEKKILDFEKRLSLICPLCKEHELKEKSTAAGKLFYVCTDGACGFISWGKPHHIECARCKNPFMVEATSASGQKILKCPRATCQYRRSLDVRKKVVRRRVVRRK